ncbi:Methyl-accepting chemotaxis protein-like protein [Sulfitobacter noctilucae]|uniref:methyl-accepting chemotaxis protein n=1 Tax=Sulfitobacter noctilucae TaxID=1342302 RepID=UPI000469FD3E|nr:methyl-accepting chemotaxis protein [Sulfitobacter noctilucae]KIN60929.1 Methyl-accepting chemotaxis protein-like protein [Sulfitobacter noctilucae]
MSAQFPVDGTKNLDALAKTASELGFEIVDIAGFLDLVDQQAKEQRGALSALNACARDMTEANTDVSHLVKGLSAIADKSRRDVRTSVMLVRNVGDKTREVAVWVNAVRDRTDTVSDTLRAVTENNSEIASIAAQVNTLAINAKIEAARAGDAGRGFAVVADAINDLSQKTRTAATKITENIENLTNWISELGKEAQTVAESASVVLSQSGETDTALSRMEATISEEHAQSTQIAAQSARMAESFGRLTPAVKHIDQAVQMTMQGINDTHSRVHKLIDQSERIVQLSAGMGGETSDAHFIVMVQRTAKAISTRLDDAIAKGAISMAALFDRNYTPIPGTDPQQMMTASTEFLDRFLPEFQEAALEYDPSIVFCAAVDTNGYLPTHNRKFSQPQRNDPVWNMANARNRRIFDDRVGLKAGRNTSPFLLQVYRRDMGGGQFATMKDLSAPIIVAGRHWGGLRLAYTYS